MAHKTEEGIACADHFTFHTTQLQTKSRGKEFVRSSFKATRTYLKDDAVPTFFKNKNVESETKIGQKRSKTDNNSSPPNNGTTSSGNS